MSGWQKSLCISIFRVTCNLIFINISTVGQTWFKKSNTVECNARMAPCQGKSIRASESTAARKYQSGPVDLGRRSLAPLQFCYNEGIYREEEIKHKRDGKPGRNHRSVQKQARQADLATPDGPGRFHTGNCS